MTVSVDGEVVGAIDVPADGPAWVGPIRVPAAANRPPASRLELESTRGNRPGQRGRRESVAFHSLWIYSPDARRSPPPKPTVGQDNVKW
jgi:hypothetical protein